MSEVARPVRPSARRENGPRIGQATEPQEQPGASPPETPGKPPAGRLTHLPIWAKWVLVAVLTVLLAIPMDMVKLPASYLLAAIIAGIAVQLTCGGMHLWKPFTRSSEALLGCMIAASITPVAISTFVGHAPLFLAIVIAIIAASTLLGWLLMRLDILPGTTALWGLSPGAAQAMLLMAGAFGADSRLVAFMQYMRILLVAALAPIIASIWGDAAIAPHAAGAAPVTGLDWTAVMESLAVAAVGLAIGTKFRIAAGSLLVPMVIGAILHGSGLVSIQLPGWLMSISYMVMGWGVGLNFTKPVLRNALGAMPKVLAATAVLLAFCGGLAVLLHEVMGIDPLTAYLATSPGGMSSVAIIAATSRVDVAFVISLQTLRFLLVLMVGPMVSRFVAGHSRHA